MAQILDEPSSLRALELQQASTIRLSARALIHPFLNATIAVSLALIAVFLTLAALPDDSPDRDWMPAGLALAAMVLVTSFPATYVVIGADGIYIRAPMYKRFLGYSDVDTIRTGRALGPESGLAPLQLVTTGGEVLGLWALRSRRVVVGARLGEALESFRQRLPAPDASSLGRAGRDDAAWTKQLRELGEKATGEAANAPMSADRLWRILENPASKPMSRVAAAVALTATYDKSTRERLYNAARMTAWPPARKALDAAARGDDESVLASKLRDVEAATKTR